MDTPPDTPQTFIQITGIDGTPHQLLYNKKTTVGELIKHNGFDHKRIDLF